MRTHLIRASFVVAVVAPVACGSDDDTSATTTPAAVSSAVPTDRDAFVAAAVDAMGLPDDDASACLAGSVIDAVGMDRIAVAGLTPEAFARATSFEEMGVDAGDVDAAALQSALAGCGDLVELFVRDAPSEEAADCVREVMSDDLAAEVMVGDLTGATPGGELAAALDDAAGCTAATTTG